MCKMYQFVHALSYTASIFILMIICIERYFAIIYPITCKQILTSVRLRVSDRNFFLLPCPNKIYIFIFHFITKHRTRQTPCCPSGRRGEPCHFPYIVIFLFVCLILCSLCKRQQAEGLKWLSAQLNGQCGNRIIKIIFFLLLF